MNFIRDHWQGYFSIVKCVWVSGIAALLVCLPVGYLNLHSFLVLNHLNNADDIMTRVADGSLASFVQPPFILRATDQLFGIATAIWWSVGTWRACANPDNNRPKYKNRWWLKTTIVMTIAYQFYDLADFVLSSGG